MEDTTQAQEVPAEEAQSEAVEEKKAASGSSFYKNKINEVQAENARLAAELEAVQTRTLQEKENFKELWELEKNKRVEAENKATEISNSYFNGLKMSAIEQAALKAGIRDTAIADLSMVDNSLVQIETTSTGNANILGASEFVEQLKESRPHWFTDQRAPIINNANPEAAKAVQYSPSDLLKLQKENPEAYKREMMKRING